MNQQIRLWCVHWHQAMRPQSHKAIRPLYAITQHCRTSPTSKNWSSQPDILAQAIKPQISNFHNIVSSSYINNHCKNIVLWCCSLCLYNNAISFYLTWLFTMFHLQRKDSNMHAYAHLWLPNDSDRNQQKNWPLGPFHLQHDSILVSNPIHRYSILNQAMPSVCLLLKIDLIH